MKFRWLVTSLGALLLTSVLAAPGWSASSAASFEDLDGLDRSRVLSRQRVLVRKDP